MRISKVEYKEIEHGIEIEKTNCKICMGEEPPYRSEFMQILAGNCDNCHHNGIDCWNGRGLFFSEAEREYNKGNSKRKERRRIAKAKSGI